ncbi:MAG TPA: porin [Gemmatimonadaceae bacterium]|nr:porin [Gemmatimonadaceae bacterium]
MHIRPFRTTASPSRVSPVVRVTLAVLAAVMAAAPVRPLLAQHPLTPSPVLRMNNIPIGIDFGGYLVVRERIRDDTSTFTVERARLTIQTRPVPFLALRFQGDLAAIGNTSADTVPSFVLTDAYVQIADPDTTRSRLHPTLIVGQFKTPFSVEYLSPFSTLPTTVRSEAVELLSTKRDIGVMGEVRDGRHFRLAGALVNGEGDNTTTNADGKQMAIGRLTLLPFSDLAVAVKWLGQGGDHRWGYDATWISGRWIVQGEVLRRNGPGDDGVPLDGSGGYALALFKLRPWLQPVLKWEQVHTVSTPTLGPRIDQQLTHTTFGINVVTLQEHVRTQIDYILKTRDPVSDADELQIQVIGIF